MAYVWFATAILGMDFMSRFEQLEVVEEEEEKMDLELSSCLHFHITVVVDSSLNVGLKIHTNQIQINSFSKK